MSERLRHRIAEEIRDHCIDWRGIPHDTTKDAATWLADRILAIVDEAEPMAWVVSDRCAGVQQWIVHQRGPNRPNKLPVVFDSKRQAEAVAEHLNLFAVPEASGEKLPDFVEDVLDMAANGVWDSTEDGPKIDRVDKWLRALLARLHDTEAVEGEREEVRAFAALMEDALREHDDSRGPRGWIGDEILSLVRRVEQETAELRAVVEEMEASHKPPGRAHAGDPEDLSMMRFVRPIGKEAADVANMAMMVADVAGALVVPKHRLRTHSPEEPVGYCVVSHEGDGSLVTWGRPGRAHVMDLEEAEDLRDYLSSTHIGSFRVHPIGQPLDGEGES